MTGPDKDQQLAEAIAPHTKDLLREMGYEASEEDPPQAESDSPGTPEDEPAEAEEAEAPAAPEQADQSEMARLAKMAEDRQTFITQLLHEREQQRQEIAAIKAQMTPKEVVPDELDQALEALSAYGVDKNAIKRGLERMALGAVDARLTPVAQAIKAKQDMATMEPGYAENAQALESFIASDQQTKQVVEHLQSVGDYEAAELAAWYRFQRAKAPEIQKAAEEKAKAAREARAAAKKQGGVISAQNASPAREAESNKPDLDKMLQQARESGDSRDYMTAVVAAAFPDLVDPKKGGFAS